MVQERETIRVTSVLKRLGRGKHKVRIEREGMDRILDPCKDRRSYQSFGTEGEVGTD